MNYKYELWDLYDFKMQYVGKIRRGTEIPPGLYHMCVEVIPTDMQGHILITQRSLSKKFGSGKFEFPAGSVKTQEHPAAAALRELREETGLNASKIFYLQMQKTPYDPEASGLIRKTYVALVDDLPNKEITLQIGETISYQLVTVDTLITEYIAKGLFDENRLKMYEGDFFDRLRSLIGPPKENESGKEPVADSKPKIRLVKRTAENGSL